MGIMSIRFGFRIAAIILFRSVGLVVWSALKAALIKASVVFSIWLYVSLNRAKIASFGVNLKVLTG